MSELRIPDLGEGIEEGTITAVLVAVGDVLAPGQSVIEIETDKVTLEVPAPRGGTIIAIEVSATQSVRPGDLVLRLAAAPDDMAGDTTDDIEAGRGGHDAGTPRASCDTARDATHGAAPTDVPAPVRESFDAVSPPADNGAEHAPAAPAPYRPLPAGPAARREARELGVDLAAVAASGPRGRITREDVRRHVRSLSTADPSGAAPGPATTPPPLPDLAAHGPVRREPLSRIERTTAANLVRASSAVPMAWVTRDVDVSTLEPARRR
ncbi:MAG: biotin/lipoyl-containing protein, partial [Gammaproteobacteria bacterium]